jgi:hypothetical protein
MYWITDRRISSRAIFPGRHSATLIAETIRQPFCQRRHSLHATFHADFSNTSQHILLLLRSACRRCSPPYLDISRHFRSPLVYGIAERGGKSIVPPAGSTIRVQCRMPRKIRWSGTSRPTAVSPSDRVTGTWMVMLGMAPPYRRQSHRSLPQCRWSADGDQHRRCLSLFRRRRWRCELRHGMEFHGEQ